MEKFEDMGVYRFYGLYGFLLERCGEEDGKRSVNIWIAKFHMNEQWR